MTVIKFASIALSSHSPGHHVFKEIIYKGEKWHGYAEFDTKGEAEAFWKRSVVPGKSKYIVVDFGNPKMHGNFIVYLRKITKRR